VGQVGDLPRLGRSPTCPTARPPTTQGWTVS